MPPDSPVAYYLRWGLRAWHVVVAPVALGAPFLLAYCLPCHKADVYRCSATLYYLVGSILTALGIYQNVKLFAQQGWGVPTWGERLKAWWSDRSRKGTPKTVQLSGRSDGVSGASLTLTVQSRPLTAEERLDQLETARDQLRAELNSVRVETRKLAMRVTADAADVTAAAREVRAVIVGAFVDGAQDQLLGIWLLAVGGFVSLFPWSWT